MSRFELGNVVTTAAIYEKMLENASFGLFVFDSLRIFSECDWGTMSKEDKKLNDKAVREGEGRIHGVYIYPQEKVKIWIITESDRSVTTVLFPSEY